ncbi:MAG TPA: phosphate uptake regulator PhoU [Candidatus Bathyarchaeia archaeon]
METRKIMALGKSSLVVSLPRDWIKMNNLHRGDSLTLQAGTDLSLILHPELKNDERKREIEIKIDPDDSDGAITRMLIGSYLNGYNIITVTSTKIFPVEQQRAIRGVVKSLYLRIIESQASQVVLQSLMDESMASIFQALERMHIITSSMCRDVHRAMVEWDLELARSVISLEEDVDQFMYFLFRLIRSAAINPSLANWLGVDMLDCLDYQTLVSLIERVADRVNEIAVSIVALQEGNVKVPSEIADVLIRTAKAAFDNYDRAIDIFRSGSVGESETVMNQLEEIKRLTKMITPIPISNDQSGEAVVPLFIIRDNLRRIGEYTADIAELTIDKAYKPGS